MAQKVIGWDGSAFNTGDYGTAIIEVTTYNTPITVNGGIAAQNPLQVVNGATGASAGTITATGIYVVMALGLLSLSGQTGSVVNLELTL